jgi:DNA-binding transcriptional regulator/RsmH inhibitor MraZ
MFGEEMLIGHNDVLVDNKNRIFLPTYTKREKDDEVLLMYDQDIDRYLLFSKKVIEKKISKLETLIATAKTEQERKECKLLLYTFYEGIIKRCRVDASGRISLGETFNVGDTLTIVGANDHLVLMNNTETPKASRTRK